MGNLDSVKSLNAKFKNLRRALKLWARSLSCLKTPMAKINELIFLWDFFEEFRDWTLMSGIVGFFSKNIC